MPKVTQLVGGRRRIPTQVVCHQRLDVDRKVIKPPREAIQSWKSQSLILVSPLGQGEA